MKKKPTNRRADPLPVILMVIGALLVIGVVIWQLTRPGQPASPSGGATVPVEAIQRVTVQDAKAAFDGKTAVFVDVRDSTSYQAGHIPGAINIPLGSIEGRAGELDPNQLIIPYCT